MTVSCPDAGAYWPIPEPHDAATVHLADGGIIVLRRHGNPDGPRLVLSHGSSFSADAYFPFWSRLLPRFDLIVYDLRNHGRNPLGDLAGHHMPMMVWDNLRVVRAIDRHFGRKPKVGSTIPYPPPWPSTRPLKKARSPRLYCSIRPFVRQGSPECVSNGSGRWGRAWRSDPECDRSSSSNGRSWRTASGAPGRSNG